MDNSEFLSFFWKLSDSNKSEDMTQAAESIVNLIDAKQKFEMSSKNGYSKDKYKIYSNISENPSEDLLYTLRRLIGGIGSTGVDFRKGFLLTLSLLFEKFNNILNSNELINVIEKETAVSKSEKQHIRNCAYTGNVSMLKLVLNLTDLSLESMFNVFKILFDLMTKQRIIEESVLAILADFLEKISNNYYSELNNVKKVSKFFEKFLSLISNITMNKTNLEKIRNLNEMSILLILANYAYKPNESNSEVLSQVSSYLENYLPKKFNDQMFRENSIMTYFTMVISNKGKENEFHMSFKYFLNILKIKNDFGKVVELWNCLIDPNNHNTFKEISSKNYQLLIFQVSKFIMEEFFILKYIKDIFDSSFFVNILKFSAKNKFKFISYLIEVLQKKLKLEKDTTMVNTYCLDLMKVFGSDPNISLSPQTYKNFYIFLFNHLDDDTKHKYLDSSITNNKKVEEDEDDDEVVEPEYEEMLFKITTFKILLVNKEVNIDESMKNKVLEFFFVEYYNNHDTVLESMLADRLLLIVLALCKPKDSGEAEDKEDKTVNDMKIVKHLIKMNKFFQGLIKNKTVDNIDLKDHKIYLNFYKKFIDLSKNIPEDKDNRDKLFSILKLAFFLLLIYLKEQREYTDILSDLYEVSKFGDNWVQVYTDIFISLFHKGNNTLSDYSLNTFKKISKYMTKDSVDVLTAFLTGEEQHLDEDAYEDDVEMIDAAATEQEANIVENEEMDI